MSKAFSTVISLLLAAVLLIAVAAAVPSADITDEADEAYQEIAFQD